MKPCHFNRRRFLHLTALGAAGGLGLPGFDLGAATRTLGWEPRAPFQKLGQKLRIQPVFMYRLPTPRKQASWKSWGGVQTEAAVVEEVRRIEGELRGLVASAEFDLEVLPVVKATSAADLAGLADGRADVTLTYANTGGGDLLRACLGLSRDNLIFVRHNSGPIYYWYEALSTRYLATGPAEPASGTGASGLRAHVDDVVVDDYGEMLWRLRALSAIKSLRATRVVALGGPWGKYAADAPEIAQKRYGLEIVDVPYADFEPRLKRARTDRAMVAQAERSLEAYLSLPGTELATEREFVVNAFVLYRVFKDLMEEHRSSTFTIKSCMGTVIPMSETTACLSLGLINDEGLMAFCESDFVIIPAGILLRYVSGKPVFMHNSTFPHRQTVTCAHCMSPRRLNADRYEPTRLLTHYESDYGAAPKVDMPVGQEVCFIDPQYSSTRWLGFKGRVKANPFHEICRSQQEVEILGDWKKLKSEVRDSHWVMVYGDSLREIGYAARKLGLDWVNLS